MISSIGGYSLKETIYVIGHKNPDSDSICSAIAYAEYKNGNNDVKAIPVRLGDINRQTDFILDYFDVEVPPLMDTVKLSVEDLDFDKIPPVSPEISLKMALSLMNKNNVYSLPVVDENELLIGIVTLSDIVQNYVDVWDNTILGKSKTSIENIIDTLSGEGLVFPINPRSFDGKLLVLAMEPNTLRGYLEDNDIVICGDRKDILEVTLKSNISLIVITGNGKLDDNSMKLANERGITVISTPYDTFTASRMITQSVPINYVMTRENLVYFSLDDLVDDIKTHMSQTRYRSYPVIDNDRKVVGSISRYHLISSSKKKVILVDHNERSQSIDGLEEAEILEIIDHHRIADVFTGSPIYFRNEPVGSTCTIVASILFENGRIPSKKIAGILAAGIISDTLLFRSPTSTNTDRIMLDRLAKIADLEVEEFTLEMFKEGTSLIGKTPKELLSQDFKSFIVSKEKIGISQVYTMDPDSLKDMMDDLIISMEERAKEYDYSIFILMLTDIFEEASEMIVVGPNKDYAAQAFNTSLKGNSFYAPGVLSRKKQVIPPITNIITNADNII